MDRLTQLQDSIDAVSRLRPLPLHILIRIKMARMFTNSIFYVHEKSNMAQLNDSIPIAQPKGEIFLP